MKSMIGALAFAAFAFAAPVEAQDTSSQLVGTWRYVAQTLTEVQSGKVSKPYGEKPTGYITYTKGGRILFVLFGDRQKPAMPFKDEDKIKLFDTLAAGSGTYKAEGDKLTNTYDTSWHELWTNTTQSRTFKIEGNKLTITSAPVKNAAGVEISFTLVLEKVE